MRREKGRREVFIKPKAEGNTDWSELFLDSSFERFLSGSVSFFSSNGRLLLHELSHFLFLIDKLKSHFNINSINYLLYQYIHYISDIFSENITIYTFRI